MRLLTLQQQFQQDIFTELRGDDELVILARGLGLLRLVTNLLHFYDAAGNNLVLVVGADDRENEWIGEGMDCDSWEHVACFWLMMAVADGEDSVGGTLCH